MPATSEPAPGSVIPSAPIFSPAIPGTSQRCFCSSVPKLKIGGIAIEVWALSPAATPPEPPERASSSTQIASCRWVPPWPPYSSGNFSPRKPSSAQRSYSSRGNSRAASHSSTFGAISLETKRLTVSRSSSCSSPNGGRTARAPVSLTTVMPETLPPVLRRGVSSPPLYTGIKGDRGASVRRRYHRRMGMPVLLVVDEEPDCLAGTEQQLRRRYGSDYQVTAERSSAAALATLEGMRNAAEPVALVLADQWLSGTTGAELLARVKAMHPSAKRGLLIEWGAWADRDTSEAIFEAMALGHIDYYVLKPQGSPDELFHRTVAEFLFEWARAESPVQGEIEIVAETGSPRAHELRDLLGRNGVPFACHPPDSAAGRALLAETGREDASVPVARVRPGRILVDPSNVELAAAFGVGTELSGEREFDVVVIGAGPAGLAAAVYASSEGMRALVVEREAIGGQAGSSSLIRNYLGFSRGVSGAELAQRAYQQAWVFGTSFLLMREVVELRPGERQHALRTADGAEFEAAAVVLASGVSYRRLEIASLSELEGVGVFYGASSAEAKALAGRRVFVVGGGNSAGQAAMHLCRWAKQVTLIVRGPSLAASMSSYLRGGIAAAENVEVKLETEVVGGEGEGRLERLRLRDRASGATSTVDADALFVLIGARPGTDWLPVQVERDEWGYVRTGQDVTTDDGKADESIDPAMRGESNPRRPGRLMLETSLPRVFAVGDVRHGSVKRVASAVGEGSVVIQQVHERLEAEAEASDLTRTA
jgi:thioredoxin reductase (NADPH)